MGITSLSQANADPALGLKLIAVGSVSAGSSLSFDSCFTSTYSNYRIVIKTDVATTMRLRASSTDASGTDYARAYMAVNGAAPTGGRVTGATNWDLEADVSVHFVVMDIFQPAEASPTYTIAFFHTGNATTKLVMQTQYHGLSTAYDGFSILGTTMTASAAVYGYRKAL